MNAIVNRTEPNITVFQLPKKTVGSTICRRKKNEMKVSEICSQSRDANDLFRTVIKQISEEDTHETKGAIRSND